MIIDKAKYANALSGGGFDANGNWVKKGGAGVKFSGPGMGDSGFVSSELADMARDSALMQQQV